MIGRKLGFRVKSYAADWDTYGLAAGPIRNRVMLDQQPDIVMAFHEDPDLGKGTRDCVDEALLRGFPVEVCIDFPRS